MSFNVKIQAHSIDERGNELLTVSCTFPRIILSEMNTHRMLSKNTSSSRAIPFNKMVEAVETNPFIPIAFQKHHSGMQGTEYHTDDIATRFAPNEWLRARDYAVEQAKFLYKNCEVTKQLCNRLLEPFMWTTMLITGPVKGGWDNFFNLRCPDYIVNDEVQDYHFKSKKDLIENFGESEILEGDFNIELSELSDLDMLKINSGQGEIHIMKLAEMIYDALQESTPILKKDGEWHIPYFNDYLNTNYYGIKIYEFSADEEDLVKIATSMAARESYTIVGENKEVTPEEHLALYDKLVSYDPPHSSPMEHCGLAMSDQEFIGYFRGELPKENLELTYSGSHGWCRNFRGFIPLRHIIETEK